MRDGRSRVYRRVGERYADACVIQRRYFSGCSVMVWGGVKERGRTLLVVDAGYLTGRRYVIPFIQAQANNVTFQQDNARPHIVRVVRDYLTHQHVDVLPWPAVSLDLSPIEHVWDEMERRLRHLQNQPVTLVEMGPAWIHICNNIPQAFFNTLIKSMRRRCQACINANDGHTRY